MEPSTPRSSLSPTAHPRWPSIHEEVDSKSTIAEPIVSSRMATGHQAAGKQQTGSILDDFIDLTHSKLDSQVLTKHYRLADVHFGNRILYSSLEPRSIQEMTERPDDSFGFD